MGDVLLQFLRTSLPDELAAVLQDILKAAETADLLTFSQLPDVQILLGHQDNDATKDVKENYAAQHQPLKQSRWKRLIGNTGKPKDVIGQVALTS